MLRKMTRDTNVKFDTLQENKEDDDTEKGRTCCRRPCVSFLCLLVCPLLIVYCSKKRNTMKSASFQVNKAFQRRLLGLAENVRLLSHTFLCDLSSFSHALCYGHSPMETTTTIIIITIQVIPKRRNIEDIWKSRAFWMP